MKTYDVEYEPLVIGKTLYDYIKSIGPNEDYGDMIALYFHYYYTAKWQKSHDTKSTTSYTANALNWSEARVRKTKRKLLKLGLIEDKKSRENGNITGHFVYVKFVWSDAKVREVQENCKNEEKATLTISHRVEKRRTNALGSNRGNALSNNTREISTSKNIFLQLSEQLASIIQNKKNIKLSIQQINTWSKSIKQLNTNNEIDIKRIKKAMDWYSEHIGEPYVPVIESGASFKAKFLNLEGAIDRSQNSFSPQPKQSTTLPPKKKNDAYQKNKDNEPVSVWGQTDQDDLDALEEANNQHFRKHRRRMNKSEQERWLEKRLGF